MMDYLAIFALLQEVRIVTLVFSNVNQKQPIKRMQPDKVPTALAISQ